METMQAKNMIDLDGVKGELIENSNNLASEIKLMKEELEGVETKLKKQILNANNEPIGSTILNILKDRDYQEKVINSISKGGSVDYSFNMKLIRNAIHQPANFGDGDAPVVLPFRELGVDKAPVRPPMVADLIQWGTTSRNMVDWIERTAKTNGAAARAEDALMTEGSLTYEEQSTKVKIMSEYMKVTKESLKDVEFLGSEINSELLSDLKLLVDTQLLSGDGTGANLKGILPQATAWAAGNFASSITKANAADVLRIGITKY
jgi:HK97 family phage major capsid protein